MKTATFAVPLLFAMAGIMAPTATSGPLPLHAGCFYYGWVGTPVVPLPVQFVKEKATYEDFNVPPAHPAPYDTMKCDPPQGVLTHWTSWADSCLGVPANTAVFGAWCGPVVTGSSILCTVAGVPPNHSDRFTVGFDVNHDGYVNELDSSDGASAPLSTEPWGAPFGAPTSAYSDPPFFFGQVPIPPGSRMIAFPLSTVAFGATAPANFAISCIAP